METPKMKDNKISFEIEAAELSPAQVRQIKTLLTLVTHATKTDKEDEFFNVSAEAMRLCASLIKQGNFPRLYAENGSIPYDQQAIEYAIDIVQEQISKSQVVSYDN